MLKINFFHAISSVILFIIAMALSGIFTELFWIKAFFFVIAIITLYWAIGTLLALLDNFSSWIHKELKGNINEKSI